MIKTLVQIQKTYNRAGVTDVKGLRKDTEEYLDKTINVDSRQFGVLGGVWNMVAENVERDEWKSYTREDWAEIEYEHIEKASFTVTDLYDNIASRFECGRITAEEARIEFTSYRECEYVFCIEVFKPRRKDQRFCCRNCKDRQLQAECRFECTGTYLPEHVYKENRDETDERNYKSREVAMETETITEVVEPFERNREKGNKRCRKREEIYGITPTKGENNPVCSGGNKRSNLPNHLQGTDVVSDGVVITPAVPTASL
jgi:hypothetical protein